MFLIKGFVIPKVRVKLVLVVEIVKLDILNDIVLNVLGWETEWVIPEHFCVTITPV